MVRDEVRRANSAGRQCSSRGVCMDSFAFLLALTSALTLHGLSEVSMQGQGVEPSRTEKHNGLTGEGGANTRCPASRPPGEHER